MDSKTTAWQCDIPFVGGHYWCAFPLPTGVGLEVVWDVRLVHLHVTTVLCLDGSRHEAETTDLRWWPERIDKPTVPVEPESPPFDAAQAVQELEADERLAAAWDPAE